MNEIVPVTNNILRRQALEAVLIFACRSCGAPGVYKSHDSIRAGWPACYVEPGDPKDTKSVGDHCPNCGASRAGLEEPLGEIWQRVWVFAKPSPLTTIADIIRKGLRLCRLA